MKYVASARPSMKKWGTIWRSSQIGPAEQVSSTGRFTEARSPTYNRVKHHDRAVERVQVQGDFVVGAVTALRVCNDE